MLVINKVTFDNYLYIFLLLCDSMYLVCFTVMCVRTYEWAGSGDTAL